MTARLRPATRRRATRARRPASLPAPIALTPSECDALIAGLIWVQTFSTIDARKREATRLRGRLEKAQRQLRQAGKISKGRKGRGSHGS